MLLVSIIGYQSMRKQFSITGDDTLEIDMNLVRQPLQTGEVVVSASKRVQTVQEVPITISTIDSRVLRQRNITKLDDALLYVPGVNLNGDHVSIRGSSGFAFGTGSRVALLLDGYPILSGDNGDMKFDMMPLFEVERVEVVKGAGSALYGTSALGGVVNVVTKEPDETPDLHFRAFTGVYTKPRFESWQYSSRLHKNSGVGAGYSQKTGNLGFDISGAWFGNESYRLFDDSYRVNLFSKIKYSFQGNNDLTLTGIFANEDKADWVYWSSLDSATRPPAAPRASRSMRAIRPNSPSSRRRTRRA
jgi:iron complex outermembrane receptor protein